MEYSLCAYLERQPTDILERLLQDCLPGKSYEDYAYIAPVITEILAVRTQTAIKDKSLTM